MSVAATIASGDPWCGGFFSAVSHGEDLEPAALFGLACASFAPTGLGSDVATVGFESTEVFMMAAQTYWCIALVIPVPAPALGQQ